MTTSHSSLSTSATSAGDYVAHDAPRQGSFAALVDVWRHRRFFWFFCRRFVRFRYKQSLFGWFWLCLRSFLWIMPFAFVVGQVADRDVEGVPYEWLVLAGLMLWNFFANAVSFATISLRYDRDIVAQLGLPPLLLLLASVCLILIEFVIGLVVLYLLAGLQYWHSGQWFLCCRAELLWIVVLVPLAACFAAAIGMVSSVCERYVPDTRMVLAYGLSLWMLGSPVLYPLSALSPQRQAWMWLNPMTPLIESFRSALLGVGVLSAGTLLSAAALAILSLYAGTWFFIRATAFQDYASASSP